MNRRFIIIGGLVLFAIFVIILILVRPKPSNIGGSATSSTQAEKGGKQELVLTGTEQLTQILLPEQFVATKQGLNDYVSGQVSKTATTAKISDTAVMNDGSVQFKVLVTGVNQGFVVTLDRSNFSSLGFSVTPGTYKQTLVIYSSPSD